VGQAVVGGVLGVSGTVWELRYKGTEGLFCSRMICPKSLQRSSPWEQGRGDCSVRGSSGGLSRGWNPIDKSMLAGGYFRLSAGAA
jgi:hypothetical protein